MIIVKRRTAWLLAVICILTIVGVGSTKLWYENSVTADTEVAVKEGIEVPILMYHSVLKDTNRSGKYVITPSQMEDDLKYLLWGIEQRYYTTPVTNENRVANSVSVIVV